MRHIILVLFILIAVNSFPAFADRAMTIDGIVFNVDHTSFGIWSKPRHHMVNDMVEHTDKNGEALSYIAVTYSVSNNNESGKLDLGGKIEYKLFDEFGNRYRAVRKQDNFKEQVLALL